MKISIAQVAVASALHIGISHGAPSQTKDDSLALSTPALPKIIANSTMAHYDGDKPGKTPGIVGGLSSADPAYSTLFWPAILDYWHYTGDSAYNDALMKSILARRGPNNDFWPANFTFTLGFANTQVASWAHVAMAAAEYKFPDPPRDQPQWIQLADNVFNILTGLWDSSDECGGGLRMSQDPRREDWKLSDTNGRLFNLAARLGRYTGNQTYVDWADKVWTWMEKVKFITADGDVVVGANIKLSPDCSKPSSFTYSGDNAVLAAGAAVMYNLTNGDTKWKTRLSTVLDEGITTFFPSETGVLTETCQSDKSCHLPQYWGKTVSIPFYAATLKMAPFTGDKLMPLIKKSAEDIAGRCFDNKGYCPLWTTGPHKVDSFATENDVAGLGAVSALLVDDAPAPVTKKSGGTSNPGGDNGKSKSDGGKDSGAPARDVGRWAVLLVAASTGLGYLL